MSLQSAFTGIGFFSVEQAMRAVSWENVPKDLCRHTERRIGGALPASPSFGMTPTAEYNLFFYLYHIYFESIVHGML